MLRVVHLSTTRIGLQIWVPDIRSELENKPFVEAFENSREFTSPRRAPDAGERRVNEPKPKTIYSYVKLIDEGLVEYKEESGKCSYQIWIKTEARKYN